VPVILIWILPSLLEHFPKAFEDLERLPYFYKIFDCLLQNAVGDFLLVKTDYFVPGDQAAWVHILFLLSSLAG
jgi:hypothetical protein